MSKIKTVQRIISDILPLIFAAVVILGAFSHFLDRSTQLWITSPSGKTTIKLPFYMALRIVKKRGWVLTKVEPVKHLSRWEHFKLAIGK